MKYEAPKFVTTLQKNALTGLEPGSKVYDTDLNTFEITHNGGVTPIWNVILDDASSTFLQAINNLSDVDDRDEAIRNLGSAIGFALIKDETNQVYTTLTQPAFIVGQYTESGHTVQLCPFDEANSPRGTSQFCTVGNIGLSNFDLLDATGSVVQTIKPSEIFRVSNINQSLGGQIAVFKIVGQVNEQFGEDVIVDFQNAYSFSPDNSFSINAAPFRMLSGGSIQDSISSAPTNSGSFGSDSVVGAVFEPQVDVKITALKVWDGHFTVNPPLTRTCVIYDRITEDVLALADVSRTSPLVNGYRFALLERPLFVKAGTQIVCVQRYYAGDFHSVAVTPTTDMDVIESASRIGTPGVEFPNTFGGTINEAFAGFFDFEPLTELFKFDSSGIFSSSQGQILATNITPSLSTPTFAGTVDTVTGFDIPSVGVARVVVSSVEKLRYTSTENISFQDLNLNSNDILNLGLINGIKPSGGVFTQIANGAAFTGVTETEILGTGVGSLLFDANTFEVGSSTFNISGFFDSDNGDILTLRLVSNFSGTPIILASLLINLENSTSQFFELETNFTIRALGAATTAELATNFDFTYNKTTGNEYVGQRVVEVNTTTFDTTIANTLSLTAQFNSASASNSIQTVNAVFSRTY